jgi:hypothetical protein
VLNAVPISDARVPRDNASCAIVPILDAHVLQEVLHVSVSLPISDAHVQ